MSKTKICRGGRGGRNGSLLADRRGAVAFEMPFIFLFLMMTLLLPMADLAVAGWQYISAWQALRAFGQAIQYSPPDNAADPSNWVASVTAHTGLNYTISNLQIRCGDSNGACSGTPLPVPMYYFYQTSITLVPMVLTSILCPVSCTYTLSYSERFK